MFSTNSISYINSLDHNLKLFTFWQAPDRKADGKKDHKVPSWKNDDDLKVRLNGSDNGLAVKLGKQFDGSYLYCLDFDTSYEEASAVHMDKFDRSNICFYLESTLHGGHILLRSDAEIELIDHKQIVLKETDGHAICEILGEGQCAFIAPSPEKEHRFGDLNQIFASHVIEQFVLEVADRYGFSFDSLKKAAPVKSSDTASRTTSDPLNSPLDYFNTNIQLIQFKLDEEGYQLMGENELGFLYKRPDRTPDGDASIILFSERTERTCYVIHTFSHHMVTFDGDNCASKFFELEHDIASSEMVKWVCDNSDYDQLVKEKVVEVKLDLEAIAKNTEAKKARKMEQSKKQKENVADRSYWFTYDEVTDEFTVKHTPAEAIRYGSVNSKNKALAQPQHLFAGVGSYFKQKTEASPKPQRNGAVLAQLMSASYVSQRLFASNHTASGVDKPAFYAAFLASSTSGKGNVLDLASDCFTWYAEGYRDEMTLLRERFPKACDWKAIEAINKAEAEGDEEKVAELREKGTDKAYEFLEQPWSFLDIQTQQFASSQALASCLMRRGSATLIIDEVQDALLCRTSGQSGSNRNSLADGFAKQMKELYTLNPSKRYGGSWCKDEQKNDRLVMNPALNIFGTGVNKDDFREWMNSKAEDGFEGRWLIWSGNEYVDRINLNIRERTDAMIARTKANEAIDTSDIRDWAYRYGRYYALLLFHYSTTEFFENKKKLVFSDIVPSAVEWTYDAELFYQACWAWLDHKKGLTIMQETILGRSLNKLSNIAILYAVLRERPSDSTLFWLEEDPWSECKSLIESRKMQLSVTREDVEKAIDVVIWDVVQQGVFNEGNVDEERQFAEEESHAKAWKKFFEEEVDTVDSEGRKFFTWTMFKGIKKSQLDLTCPSDKKARQAWLENEVEEGFLEQVDNVRINRNLATIYYLAEEHSEE